ncbi:site-2 protease family protein [Pseudanabaena sp. PCC 6802]|uniref:site-2 protease family protein n=1 Tax=Pseudanabaena sp. PCC 6802 TaxID=118173 RepID=UPI000345A1C7|nr:site-2 protease family protein [Pseudanabaena sp. PCC 6802]
MKGGIRIGTIFKIPLFIDPSWFLIVALMTLSYRTDYVRLSPDLALLFGFLTAVLLFVSVLLHELGHSLTAKSQGIEVNSITLFLFGGVAAIEKESKDPWSAFSVAIAGPIVSLALGGILWGTALALAGNGVFAVLNHPVNPQAATKLVSDVGINRALVGSMAFNLAQINLVLGIFNLIPGLPLDGGQVLKAVVWKITGNRMTGVRWAARSGQFLGLIAIFMGVNLLFLRNGLFYGIWPILLGWFVMNNASAYLQFTNLQEALMGLTAELAMTRDFRIVDAKMSLRQFADEFLLLREDKDIQPAYFASADGRDRGAIAPEDFRYIERSQWESKTLNDIAKPFKSLDVVELKAKIVEVIKLLEEKQIKRLTVLSPVGSVAGVIDRGDVLRALARKLKWPIPEAYIQQVKADGKFPPDLRLSELIAQIPPN